MDVLTFLRTVGNKFDMNINEEPIDTKGSFEHIEPKLEGKEETLKAESSGVDQRHEIVDHLVPKDNRVLDFVQDIEFPDDIKPKLEIKEEPIDTESNFDSLNIKSDFEEETSYVICEDCGQKGHVHSNCPYLDLSESHWTLA